MKKIFKFLIVLALIALIAVLAYGAIQILDTLGAIDIT